MKQSIIASALLLSFATAGIATGQEIPEMPKPTKEHQWLKKFAGRWTATSKGVMEEGQPPVETTATINSQLVGGFWIINRMQGKFKGPDAKASAMTFKGIQTIGYDVKKKKYVGTWIASMDGYLWHYQGTVEKNGTKLVLEADGPDMVDPTKTIKYRDAYEFKSKDEMIVTSSMQKPDGTWFTFMNGTSKRIPKKAKAKKGGEKEKRK